jgi:hypothetical protein
MGQAQKRFWDSPHSKGTFLQLVNARFLFAKSEGEPSVVEHWEAAPRFGYMWKYIGLGIVALWTVVYFILNAVGTLQTARDLFQNRGEILRVTGIVLT